MYKSYDFNIAIWKIFNLIIMIISFLKIALHCFSIFLATLYSILWVRKIIRRNNLVLNPKLGIRWKMSHFSYCPFILNFKFIDFNKFRYYFKCILVLILDIKQSIVKNKMYKEILIFIFNTIIIQIMNTYTSLKSLSYS